jgi:hypothetical protein
MQVIIKIKAIDSDKPITASAYTEIIQILSTERLRK